MASGSVFGRHSIKSTQTVKTALLLLLAVTAGLMLEFRQHHAIILGILLALSTVALPGVYMATRRVRESARQRETEDRLMMHTRTYLRNQEPARAMDGRKLPMQDFRKFHGTASVWAVGAPAIFGALPPRYAIADFAAALPGPASAPLGELLPRPPQRTGSRRRGRRT